MYKIELKLNGKILLEFHTKVNNIEGDNGETVKKRGVTDAEDTILSLVKKDNTSDTMINANTPYRKEKVKQTMALRQHHRKPRRI